MRIEHKSVDALPSYTALCSRRYIGILALGHTVNKIWDLLFDYALYPVVIYSFGLIWGFMIMAILSLLSCWLLMLFYDWSKTDWLGIEAIKEIKNYSGSARTLKYVGWVISRGDLLACILLSIKFDPFITTVYLRKGRYGGMTHADWRNFMISWLIGNVYWSVFCFTGISLLTLTWNWIINAH
jgi:hypothetical protein